MIRTRTKYRRWSWDDDGATHTRPPTHLRNPCFVRLFTYVRTCLFICLLHLFRWWFAYLCIYVRMWLRTSSCVIRTYVRMWLIVFVILSVCLYVCVGSVTYILLYVFICWFDWCVCLCIVLFICVVRLVWFISMWYLWIRFVSLALLRLSPCEKICMAQAPVWSS